MSINKSPSSSMSITKTRKRKSTNSSRRGKSSIADNNEEHFYHHVNDTYQEESSHTIPSEITDKQPSKLIKINILKKKSIRDIKALDKEYIDLTSRRNKSTIQKSTFNNIENNRKCWSNFIVNEHGVEIIYYYKKSNSKSFNDSHIKSHVFSYNIVEDLEFFYYYILSYNHYTFNNFQFNDEFPLTKYFIDEKNFLFDMNNIKHKFKQSGKIDLYHTIRCSIYIKLIDLFINNIIFRAFLKLYFYDSISFKLNRKYVKHNSEFIWSSMSSQYHKIINSNRYKDYKRLKFYTYENDIIVNYICRKFYSNHFVCESQFPNLTNDVYNYLGRKETQCIKDRKISIHDNLSPHSSILDGNSIVNDISTKKKSTDDSHESFVEDFLDRSQYSDLLLLSEEDLENLYLSFENNSSISSNSNTSLQLNQSTDTISIHEFIDLDNYQFNSNTNQNTSTTTVTNNHIDPLTILEDDMLFISELIQSFNENSIHNELNNDNTTDTSDTSTINTNSTSSPIISSNNTILHEQFSNSPLSIDNSNTISTPTSRKKYYKDIKEQNSLKYKYLFNKNGKYINSYKEDMKITVNNTSLYECDTDDSDKDDNISNTDEQGVEEDDYSPYTSKHIPININSLTVKDKILNYPEEYEKEFIIANKAKIVTLIKNFNLMKNIIYENDYSKNISLLITYLEEKVLYYSNNNISTSNNNK